jgi:phosphoglucosamine mutase
MRIVVDCAHGAAYHIAPKVFHELGAEVHAIGAEPNGLNINDKVGATSPQSLQQAVVARGADLGIALDGDGDRAMMVDAKGRLYDGDQMLYVIARQRLANGGLAGVVGTLMTNLGMEHALAKLGVPVVRAKVGDRYVLETLIERGWKLGGENSGHIICLDRHTTGDGIVSALQVLVALQLQHAALEQACADLTLYPQTLVNVRLPSGFDWQKRPEIESARIAAEKELGDSGRVLLRASGTEPLLRVMVEGREAQQVATLAKGIADVVQRLAA